MSLSGVQKAAVERTGQDVCCAAGPGSGKTRVLVDRFAWLIEHGTAPERILAITFTEKAATEIKQRLTRRFEKRPEWREEIQRAPVSTVHGFCARLLREYALDAGIDPNFRVLDDIESESQRVEAMDAVLDDWAIQHTAAFRALIDAWACADPAGTLRAVHEELRGAGAVAANLRTIEPIDAAGAMDHLAAETLAFVKSGQRNTPKRAERLDKLAAWLQSRASLEPLEWLRAFTLDMRGVAKEESAHGQQLRLLQQEALSRLAGSLHEAERETIRAILLEYDNEYRRRKAVLGGLDFADLEERTLALLASASPAAREITERYDTILMDELQDTNPIQWAILERLRRPNSFFAVGDLNQSIYGFRHAEPALFEQYQAILEAKGLVIDRLETNYRSRPEILAFASTVAARCHGIRAHHLLPRETPFAEKAAPSVEIQIFDPADEADADEAAWIAFRLDELKQTLQVGDPPRALQWKDCAVLARTSTHFDTLEAALAARGIPCLVGRGRNFFEEQEVIDCTNVLRYLANPGNEIALYALLRSPLFGIADQRIHQARAAGEFPPPEAAPALAALLEARESAPPDRLVALLLDERGYLRDAPPHVEANIAKFLRLLRNMHEDAPGEWRDWLSDLDILREQGKEPNAPPLEEEDAVQLMTMHQAKGLEFPLVILAFLNRGPRNDSSPLNWSAESGLGAMWRFPGEVASHEDPILTANRRRRKEREDLESHRLLYVGMTRAEEHLVLSWHASRFTQEWIKIIAGALDLEWLEAPANTPWQHGAIRVCLHSGTPPAPEGASLRAAAPAAIFELDRLTPAPEAAPVVGVTALAHFDECPRRHYLAQVIRWPQLREAAISTGARALGDEVHRLLGHLPVQQPSAEALALRDGFLASPLGQAMHAAARVEREFDFLFALDGTLLRGVIDLWFENKDGITLVDYKTGRHIAPATLEAYATQLRFYALALEALTGRLPLRAALYLLHQDRTVDVPLGADTRAHCLDALNEWKQAHMTNEWTPRAGAQCEWCAYEGDACPGRAMLAAPDNPL